MGDEVSYSASITPGLAIPDAGGGSISSTITISQDITMESVVVPILSDHTYAGDLTITLTSPEGTTAILSEGNRNDPTQNGLNFNFSAKTFWGESSRGVWTLTINDLWERFLRHPRPVGPESVRNGEPTSTQQSPTRSPATNWRRSPVHRE